MPTKPKSPVPPRKTLAEADPPRLPPPHDDDDCVYVEPDGALYMKPEDVLNEMPANAGPIQHTNAKFLDPPEGETFPNDELNFSPFARRHGGDDCVYVEPDGAQYMKPEDVLYEMPANAGPIQHTNAKFLDQPDGKTLPKGELNSSPFARRHGGDDCVYVEPDGAQYMKPEDVLYEMPASRHCQNPVDAHDSPHYYQPLTKTTDLPTDGNGYVIVELKNLEGRY
ncbi:Hypp821 [Branchiostoma lanceolatum]|uniref:Hypp821 protein n=1 Tax=Branchiostoma lanceolatum TaxID=7740 RepID=A0A8J9YQK1_BRALA|nr:Hypp821 [Branchiostoma lanceolatum]